MRYLIISLSFLLLNSCNLATTKNLITTNTTKVVENLYFANIKTDYVYKAKIKTANHNFGGLLILKQLKNKHHRIVFTTEFGTKIFDFEFIDKQFKVNSVIDKLDKKIILNALRKDFQLLVNQYNNSIREFDTVTETIYQSRMNKKDTYYFLEKSTGQLSKIVMASKRKEKMTIYFKKIKNNIANNITMKHHNFKMTIELNYIN